jgi:hypothetical protein
MIFYENMRYKKYVLDVIEFRDAANILQRGSSNSCVFGTERFKGTLLAVRIGCE